MINYIFYSHYDYSDVWPIMKAESDKFLANQKKTFFTNKVGNYDFSGWNVVLYDENLSYQKRVSSCLEKLKDEIIIFHHEDMFLLTQPQFDEIEKISNFIRSGKMDFVKLCRASYGNNPDLKIRENIYRNPKNLGFAIQPTVTKLENWKKIYDNTLGSTIWEFEKNASHLVEFLRFNSCYCHLGVENKRGMFHWDSHIYPYIATAVAKGKWDYECYADELTVLLKKYGIDPNIRGKNA